MNPRERILAVVLLGVVVLVGSAAGLHQLYWKPLLGRNAVLADLERKIDLKEQQLVETKARKAQVEHWRMLSLPADVHLAWGDYQKHLKELLAESGFSSGAMTVKSREPPAPSKKLSFTKLDYELSGPGTLASLVKLLEKFYRTPLLHQVKSISIQKPQTLQQEQKPDELDLKLHIEALIVDKAQARKTLLPEDRMPELQVLAPSPRRYSDIATRNIFMPPPPPPTEPPPKESFDVTPFVHLTDITLSFRRNEAFLYDRYSNRQTRLRASAGFDTFRFADNNDDTLVRGKVIRIDERDVYFQANDKFYRLHVDQTIHEAMRKALTEQEVKELKLEAAPP